jgi:hypothetical protein
MPIVGDGRDPQNRSILKLPDTATLHDWFAKLSADPAPKKATPKTTAPRTPAAPQTVAPSAVKVRVFNGSGTPGLAASTATALQTAGFTVAGTGNADSADYTRTEIRYAAGDAALATTLAGQFPGAKLTQQTGVTPGTVELVIGSDFTAVGKPLTPVATTAAAAPATSAADKPRTAADTSCIN